MALNIKNPEVERLAAELAELTKETKTEAIRRSLEERKARLALGQTPEEKQRRLIDFLEREVWSKLPPEMLGKAISQEEQDEILGYGPDGSPE